MSSQVDILRKKIFWAPNRSGTHDFPEYHLDALTTELWETRGEQGHMLDSSICGTLFHRYLDFVKITNSIHLLIINIFDMACWALQFTV